MRVNIISNDFFYEFFFEILCLRSICWQTYYHILVVGKKITAVLNNFERIIDILLNTSIQGQGQVY